MSEYQYIAFRAIDRPVSPKNLAFMRRQSTRAEITPWSFDNEYHFGDFRGDAFEMLRRGYDLHFHYANFGIRTLCLRFPHGLPNRSAFEPYLADRLLRFLNDKQGPGGILCIEPFYEAGELDDLWEFDDILNRLVLLRAEIQDGDLRPLYLAHLAIATDGEHDPQETTEAPVPAGLEQLTDAQRALAEFCGLSDNLLAAAARHSPPMAAPDDPLNAHAEWLRRQSQNKKDAWLAELMASTEAHVRSKLLVEFHQHRAAPIWPTAVRRRTIAQLQAAAAEIEQEANRRAAEKAARQSARRRSATAADPSRILRRIEQLVKQRTRLAYGQISELLAELRSALAGSDRADLAEQQAQKLKNHNPTLRSLISELRHKGFLAK
jgi:hypothetical protein